MDTNDILRRIVKPEDYNAIIESKQEYVDKNFPPTKQSLGKDYNYPFKRAKDIFKGKYKVFEKFECDDIIQGANGDCYFLSAMASLAEFPGRVEKLFATKEVNESGCYAINLYVGGYPVTVTVDDNFAYDEKSHALAFSGSNQKELWVMLIEKAWAKLHMNYTIIDGGDGRESLGALTGAPVDKLDHASYKSPDDLWKDLRNFDRLNYIMNTGGVKEQAKGIEKAHAYTLINTYEIKSNGQEVRLLQIRNPWGSGEWNGDWSDKDTAHWTPELNKQLNHSNKDDGTFFMKFEDFIQVYKFTFVARYRDEFVASRVLYDTPIAFAAFRFTKTLKGAASAYQLTNRLTLAYKGVEKGIKPLMCEVLKVSGSSIESINLSVVNNAIGFCHLPLINLEPGTYVLQARFTADPNPLPFLNLVVYADQAVDMIKLNAKHIKDIKVDMLENEFAKITSAYTTKVANPSQRAASSFTHCPKSHLLVWSTVSTTKDNTFSCEACRKDPIQIGEGRWYCAQCDYDVCQECRPKDIAKVELNEEKKVVGLKCISGHPMDFKNSPNATAIVNCDKCGIAFLSVVERWQCEPCQYDLCRNCVAPPPDFKQEGPIPQITTCQRQHPLSFGNAMTAEGQFTCDICHNIGNPNLGRSYCENCNVNICQKCIPNSNDSSYNTTAATMTTACLNNHVLQFTCDYPFYLTEMKCDKCEAQIPLGSWRWNCYEDQYDICNKCRSPPMGRIDVKCNRGHLLQYSKLPIGSTTYTRCDRCHQAFNVTNGRYCCSVCHFDLCPECEPYKQAQQIGCDGRPIAECSLAQDCHLL